MYEKGLLEVKTDQKTDHFGKKVRFPDFRRQTGPKYQLSTISLLIVTSNKLEDYISVMAVCLVGDQEQELG